MKSFFRKWLWEGKKTTLLCFSVLSLLLWCGLYVTTPRNPFVNGWLVISMIISPLLILPFSKVTYRVWLLFSVFALPFAFYQVAFVSIDGEIFNKTAANNGFGVSNLALTILIIILVPICQWLYKKLKG